MIIKILRWLFGVRPAPIMRGPETVDAWDELLKRGYSVESYPADGDLRHYSFWRDGQLVTDWSDPITLDEFYRMRRLWSVDELARLESEKRHG